MGKKWLLIAALALVAILIVMWRQVDSSEATPAPTAPEAKQESAPTAAPQIAVAPEPVEPKSELVPVSPLHPTAPPPKPPAEGKYDPQSDEFFYKHDELVVPMVMRSVVKCWEEYPKAKREKMHRGDAMVVKFKQKIVNGTVTIYNAEIERSDIKDKALESCFAKQVIAATWHDDKLPDWEQDDEVKISPRVLKKYTQENINYVGAEAPKTPTYLTREQIDADFDKNYKE